MAKTLTPWCCGALLLLGTPLYAEEVSVSSDTALQKTVYSVTSGSCAIRWVVSRSKINEEIIVAHSECALSLTEQAPLIGLLLAKVLENPVTAASFHTLALGRLKDYPDLSAHLAGMAKASWQWDAQKGRPKSGSVNPIVVRLAREGRFFHQWDGVFQKYNRRVQVSSAEQVLISKAGDLPFFPSLARQGVLATDLLPWDAPVWLSVIHLEGRI